MFTPQKIFILIVILAVVWFLFRIIEKRNNRASAKQEEKKADTVDLVQCSKCNDWVDSPCKQFDCPIKG